MNNKSVSIADSNILDKTVNLSPDDEQFILNCLKTSDKLHTIFNYFKITEYNFYKIFAVVALKQDDEWYNFIDAPNSKNFKKNITGIMEKALYTTGVKPKFGQQLLTLSTCYGSDEDGRLIVVAVKKK